MSSIADLSLYEILDERFRTGRCANGDMRLERLHDDCRWAEGPLYLPAWRQLVWSDIPNDRMLRWDEETGAVSVFRSPAGHPNGNTLDREGRLITCEQGNRRVTRTEPDGTLTVIADRFDGKRLNSPNDAVVRSDGSIWFSDPDFGITSDYEGLRAPSEIGACNLYRADPATGEVRLAADGFLGPNGVVFSPDGASCTRRTPAQATSAPSKRPRTAPSHPTASSRSAPGWTTSASTTRAACGRRRWRAACTATPRTAP